MKTNIEQLGGHWTTNWELLNATLKVILDGQAYLYAHALQVDAEILGQSVTDEQLEAWQDEWMNETRDLIQAQFGMEEE